MAIQTRVVATIEVQVNEDRYNQQMVDRIKNVLSSHVWDAIDDMLGKEILKDKEHYVNVEQM